MELPLAVAEQYVQAPCTNASSMLIPFTDTAKGGSWLLTQSCRKDQETKHASTRLSFVVMVHVVRRSLCPAGFFAADQDAGKTSLLNVFTRGFFTQV